MKNENTYKKITVTLTPAELELIQSGLTRSANENYDRVNEIEKDLPNLAPELTGLYTEELDAINALNFKLGMKSLPPIGAPSRSAKADRDHGGKGMSRRVFYEWDIEAIQIKDLPASHGDPIGEICDHDFRDPADGGLNAYPAGTFATIDGPHERPGVQLHLVLVRDAELSREWAYTTRNAAGGLELPDTFDEGSKVPLRFKTELARWQREEAKA